MLESLRLPFFVVAAIALALVIVLELAIAAVGPQWAPAPASFQGTQPGIAINALAAIDLVLVYAMASMTLGMIWPQFVGRAQPLATLVLGLVGLLLVIVLIFAAVAALVGMLTLLFAIPFGMIAYFGLFGTFASGKAAAALAAIMTFKLVFAVCLVLAQQRFLAMKSFVLLIATSLLATWLTAFLLALTPMPFDSIMDALAAIISLVLAAIWMLVFVIMAIPGVLRTLQNVVRRGVPV